MPKFVTIREYAQHCGKTVAAIRKRIDAGKIPATCIKHDGSRILIDEDLSDDFLSGFEAVDRW